VVNLIAQFALAALVVATDPGPDTVFLKDGGQLRGVVVEESPGVSVTIQLPGGELRRLAADEVQRIEYQETLAEEAAAPPVGPATPEQAPGWRRVSPEPSTFMLAFGVGAAFPMGDAATGVAMTDLTGTQLVIGLEGGFRFTPAWMASAFFEGGLGGAGSLSQGRCRAAGYSCDSFTGSVGGQLRYTFTPLAPTTGWIALGSAWEFTEVSSSRSSNDATLVKSSGWQYLRLSAGWDLRGMHLYRSAFGIYGLAALGRYDTTEDVAGTHQLSPASTHAWIQLGVRFVLGP
jgi:hypothetical protein